METSGCATDISAVQQHPKAAMLPLGASRTGCSCLVGKLSCHASLHFRGVVLQLGSGSAICLTPPLAPSLVLPAPMPPTLGVELQSDQRGTYHRPIRLCEALHRFGARGAPLLHQRPLHRCHFRQQPELIWGALCGKHSHYKMVTDQKAPAACAAELVSRRNGRPARRTVHYVHICAAKQ